jgi:hypothetical protein
MLKLLNLCFLSILPKQAVVHKVVYAAPSLEMLDAANANQILKRALDWFYGIFVPDALIELNAISANMGQNYPNTSYGFTTIPLENVDQNMNFELSDITGKVVFQKQIAKGTNKIELSTANLALGKYVYGLSNAKGNSLNKTMMIK